MRLPVLAILLVACTSLAAAQNTAPWSYQGNTGPLVWGKLDPAYRACSKGREQSPINIHGTHLNTALKPIEFHYIAGPATVENTGHTIEVQPYPGSYIVANGVRYDLVQLHFHHPSEHAVNGKLTDMTVHLVHKSADGKLAVIAVLLSANQSFPNATMAMLWQNLPATPGQSTKITDMVNPAGLLPAGRNYWTYAGSLTTPPCTEGVTWYVYREPITISLRQLNAFNALYPMNTRPLQSTHGRRIESSK